MECIDLQSIIRDEETYPSWSTGRRYKLKVFEEYDNEITIGYVTVSNRKFMRKFPKQITVSQELLWLIGFARGEGTQSTGKSGHIRFTLTNANARLMKNAISILCKTGLINRDSIYAKNALRINRSENHDDTKLLIFWKKELSAPKSAFYFAPKRDKNKKKINGVCHLYITDALLRRIFDLVCKHVEDNLLKFDN